MRTSPYLPAAAGLLLTLAIVRYPEAAFDASLEGLKLWFDIVLPALLPFFAMSDILMGLGVIHAVGVLLEPVMRPLFRIPGVGGFAVAMGLASGYPLGAKITGQLRRDGLCNREEGERLISFANTADPLFMIGAVSVGMFGMPEIGLTLVVGHYLGVVLVGLAMRYHAGGRMSEPPATDEKAPLLGRALAALAAARERDRRPIGQIFGDAVRSSVNSMLFIGGCIMMFSVFLRILTVAGAIDWIAYPIALALGWAGASPDLVTALTKGIFEITIGSEAAASAGAPLLQRTVVAAAIIAWSGLSVHAQVAAMTYGTDIRIGPYLAARALHAALAALLAAVLFEPLSGVAATVAGVASAAPGARLPSLALTWAVTAGGALGLVALLALLGLVFHTARRVRVIIFRV